MKKKLQPVTISIVILVLILAVFGCASDETASPIADEVRTLVDMDGVEATLPMEINTVVNVWPANNQVLVLLGVQDKLIGTTSGVQDVEWMIKIFPGIVDIPSMIDGEEINAEEMLALKPDVIITNDRGVESARSTGIPVVNMAFSDYEGLKETVFMTAQVFGDAYVEKAVAFNNYFDGNIELIESRLASIKEVDKIKVYYARNTADTFLKTDGSDTMADEWCRVSGSINVASATVEGFGKDFSAEQFIIENPDVIVLMDQNEPEAMRDSILNDPRFSSVAAVQNGRIFINPKGVFYWDRYSAEQAMQILWAATTFYPEYFEDIDIIAETQNFYRTFFGYDLSESEAKDILNYDLNAGR